MPTDGDNGSVFTQSPSGPIITYTTTEIGKVLVVAASGRINTAPAPQPAAQLKLSIPQTLEASGAGGWVTLTGDDGEPMVIDASALTVKTKLEVTLDASAYDVTTFGITELRQQISYTFVDIGPSAINTQTIFDSDQIQLKVVDQTLQLQGLRNPAAGDDMQYTGQIWTQLLQVGT